MGFGKAALALSTKFVLQPQTSGDDAAGGAQVVIPIGFDLPALPLSEPVDVAAPAPPAVSEHTLRLAARIVAAEHIDKKVEAMVAKMLGDTSLNTKEQNIAIAALVAAFQDNYLASSKIERQLAATFTESQLSQIADFLDSPAGQLWVAKGDAILAGDQGDVKQQWPQIMAAAQKRFCAQVTCLADAASNAPAK